MIPPRHFEIRHFLTWLDRAFQILFRSELPTYLNAIGEKKLLVNQWLISASLCEVNHLPRFLLVPYAPTNSRFWLGSYSTM